MKQLLIYGAGEFGQTIHSLAEECDFSVAGFIDDWSTGPGILAPSTQLLTHFPPSDYQIVMAIGYRHLEARWNLFARLAQQGYQFPPLIHPRAIVNRSATIGEGSLVMAGSILDARASLGMLVVAWPASVINHDSKIGDNTFLGPGVVICGHTEIGSTCFVGAGAVVVDHINVPDRTFIKALARYCVKNNQA